MKFKLSQATKMTYTAKTQRERDTAERSEDLSTGNQRDERGFLSAVLDREKVTPEGLLHTFLRLK